MNRRISNKIYLYSFLLSVLVILVHSVNLAEDNIHLQELSENLPFWTALGLENFFSNTLGQGAVPGFFLLSGYLFFRNLSQISEIPFKWAKRVRGLAVPYIFWNSLYYVLYVLMGRALWSWEQFRDAAANYSFNPVFWYLYQLILLTALAPLFFLLIKKKILAYGSLLGAAVLVYRRFDIPYLNEDALFYYFSGAVLSRYAKSFFEEEGFSIWGVVLGILAAFLYTGLDAIGRGEMESSAYRLSFLLKRNPAGLIILGTVFYRFLLSLTIWKLLPGKWISGIPSYMKINFFLYAIHYPIVRAVFHGERAMGISGSSPLQIRLLLLSYFLLPLLVMAVGMPLSKALRKHAAGLWEICSGGR